MKDVYVYRYGDTTYINLTNRCNNSCDFCIRKNSDSVADQRLILKQEPSAQDVIAALKRADLSDEIVFCGYGEPTMNLDALKGSAEYLKKLHKRVRVNTNGLANAHYERDILPELKGLVDVMSISLNQADAQRYDAVCHSVYGEKAYEYMLDFAKKSVEAGIETVLTIVDVIPAEDIEKCRAAAESTGAKFRVRSFTEDNGNTREERHFWHKFPFYLIVIAVYAAMGLIWGLWHPGWLVFLAIPAYYVVVDVISKLKHKKNAE